MRTAAATVFTALCLVGSGVGVPAQRNRDVPAPSRVPLVSAIGCLTRGPGETWVLANATDHKVAPPQARRRVEGLTPDVSTPPADTAAVSGPLAGKNTYKLLGTEEFNVPAHAGHTVVVKGPYIDAGREKRINVIVVQRVANDCGAAAKRTK